LEDSKGKKGKGDLEKRQTEKSVTGNSIETVEKPLHDRMRETRRRRFSEGQ